MTAPAISVISTASMTTIMGTAGSMVQYEIFSDSYQFENWRDWVIDSSNSPSQTQKSNATDYENYVIKLYCQLAK